MMKKIKLSLLTLLALLMANVVNAQCGSGATISIAESRCEATGVITVNGASGSSLLYDFVSYPPDYSYTGPSASNVITGLNPGSYTLRVLDGGNNCYTDYSVTVPGNYVQPLYTPYAQDVTNCYNGSNGEIHGVMTDGRTPYTYEILAGSPCCVGSTNSSGDFYGLTPGTYNVRAYDSCGNFQTRQVTVGNFYFNPNTPVVTKTGCGLYSFDAINPNATMTGYSYKVKDANGNTIATGSSLPISFSHPDATIGNATVCITDACGTDACIPFTVADWNITASQTDYTGCNQWTTQYITISGSPVSPITYGFVRNVGDTVWSSTVPFTFGPQNSPGYWWGFSVVKDGCGVVKATPNQYERFMLYWGGVASMTNTSCTESNVRVEAWHNFVTPVYFSIDGGPSVTEGGNGYTFTNLTDGPHSVTYTDACGNVKTENINLDHTWQAGGYPETYCTVGKFDNILSVNYHMKAPITYEQWDASYSTLLSTQTYTDPTNIFTPWYSATDWYSSVRFSGTDPLTTYNYIITDDCGRKDTVTIGNPATGHLPISVVATVTPLCVNRGDITAVCTSDNPYWNSGIVDLYKFIGNTLTPITWGDNFGNSSGTRVWNNMDTGTYIVRFKLQNCPDYAYDTVVVPKYVQPRLRKSIAFPCIGTVVNAVGSVKGGIPPYQYEIFQTSPAGGEQPLQSSNIFVFNGTYTLVRMRVVDGCGNTSLQDMAVRPPASPTIKVTQKLPVCNLSQLNLYVDSIYTGAQYEWRNPAGSVISNAPAINLAVSIADTGLYTCRVYINGTCFDKTADFRLRAKEFGCFAQLGNYVWHDVNQNGTQDGNEVGVAGVPVTLYDASNTIIGATLTDAYGYYIFQNLNPGTYHVGFTLPANYVFTTANSGANDVIDSDPSTTTGLTGDYTLVAGDSNMTVDAGIYQPMPTKASLGDYVWNDLNVNGIQEPNELGVSGVTVTLYDAGGNPVATTITDGNGKYTFNDLTPATYSVGFSLPVGYLFTLQNQGNDTQDSDVDPSTGKTTTVTLTAGEHNPTLDAGIYSQPAILGALGNYVWNDVNHNGVQNSNEAGVPGVLVTLYGADGTTVLSTTTTDELGYYIFNGLNAGDYIVGFSNIPAGYVLTTQNAGSTDTRDSDPDVSTGKTALINLSQGEFDMTVDAGIYNSSLPIGALGNYVWYDLDLDGIQDATETGTAGVTVTLYDANTMTVLATTVTDATGKYLFNNLDAGSYKVGFSNLPTGYILTNSLQGTDATVDSNPDKGTGLTNTIVLGVAEVNLTVDAGIVWGGGRNGTASLGDIVWYDLNQNGIQDNAELGVPGVTVTLYEADGTTIIATTTTDPLGNYIFTGLDAGGYVVGFSNIPAGYTFTTANQGSDDELDADADATSGGKTPVYALAEGEENLTVDAGIYPAPGLASLGNYVWNDLNQDGIQDANEPGVPGVTVTLFNTSGTALSTTTTDANGAYQFTGLTPGTYYVEFSNLPNGYFFTDKDAANNTEDALDSDADPINGSTPWVTLTAGQNYPDLDAGIYTDKAGLGNYVWNDLNNDGIQNPNELGIPGITVTLYAADGVTPISTAITNANGYYSFINLDPGTYVVGFSGLPQGATFSSANQGGNDALDSDADVTTGKTSPITLNAGDYDPTVDAGIHLPNSAGLGNYVWFDADADGVQDATEPGVPGVTVTLYNVSGTAIRTAITDQAGYYTFTNLIPGTYSVGFSTLPANRNFTVANIGSEETDSDVDNVVLLPTGFPSYGTTAQYTIVAGEYNPNLDAGLKLQFPLGVTSLVAKAALQNTTAQVSWMTENETDVHHFEIERSIDGINFTVINQHTAKGNTTSSTEYAINDNVEKLMDQSTIYYRVLAYDVDNKVTVSNVVSVKTTKVTEPISLYPIPFTTHINVSYTATIESTISAIITDATGKVIMTKEMKLNKGLNTFALNDLQSLSKGTYFITIHDENKGDVFVKKITKQ